MGIFWGALEWKMSVNFVTISNILWPFGIIYEFIWGVMNPPENLATLVVGSQCTSKLTRLHTFEFNDCQLCRPKDPHTSGELLQCRFRPYHHRGYPGGQTSLARLYARVCCQTFHHVVGIAQRGNRGRARVARFSWHNVPNGGKYAYQITLLLPNGHKLCKMAVKRYKWP
jgi:hypothetical protein